MVRTPFGGASLLRDRDQSFRMNLVPRQEIREGHLYHTTVCSLRWQVRSGDGNGAILVITHLPYSPVDNYNEANQRR